MIAPHRDNRRKRFFAWIQWRRRVLVRWEFYRRNFLGFVQLAATASPYDSFEVFEIGSSQSTTSSEQVIGPARCRGTGRAEFLPGPHMVRNVATAVQCQADGPDRHEQLQCHEIPRCCVAVWRTHDVTRFRSPGIATLAGRTFRSCGHARTRKAPRREVRRMEQRERGDRD